MLRNVLRLTAGLLLMGALVACSSPGGTHVSESKSDKNTDAARVRVELGQRYMQQGRLELALENLQKALQYDSSYVDAHTVLGVLYERLGDLPQARAHYARAAELAPKSGSTNNNYGQFLCSSGQYAEAQKYFTRAMEDPFYNTRDVVYTNAGTCLLEHSDGHADEAETDFRKAIDVNPKNTLALYHLATILYTKNDFLHALAFVQRYESLSQPSPDSLLLARNIEVKLGDAGAAREYSQRLHELFPDSEQTHSLDSVTPSAPSS
jgi:type IV pilus assembly protein PilF